MIECSINNLVKFYGATKVFENISFELQSNERVGLIGLNGSGKTTLMKILMGVEDYQNGNISFRKGIRVGYLDQIFKCSEETTVIKILNSSFDSIKNLKIRMKALEENLKNLNGEALATETNNYGLLMDEFELMGGYNIETKINMVCSGLLIPDSFREKPFQELSGGEKTRVLLVKLLLEEPDLLLLDEPTNHLDIKSIEWLEEFLPSYKGTVLMVSHDRSFLDKVVHRIIELEPTVANIYNGNFSDYVVEKDIRFELAYKAYLNNQRKIEMMEKQIERYRIWGAMRDSEKMYKRAKELEKRLDKVEVIDKPNSDNSKMKLNTQGINRTGKIVINIEELSKKFEDKKLFTNLSLTLFYQDRLCIMGENGSGKTSLLKIILGELEPSYGRFKMGSNVKVGYLPQNVVFDDEELTILDYFCEKHRINQSDTRKELAKMLFIRDDVFKKIKSLSGGEKSRLKLASLIFDKVNLMILDEPTNHLDIDSREVLEETLSSYNGTILFVSHDRYFVQKVATKILILDRDKTTLYPIPYDEYLDLEHRQREEKQVDKEIKPTKQVLNKSDRKPNNTYRIGKLDEEIKDLEERLSSITKEMTFNNDNADRLYELFLEKEQIEDKLINDYELFENLQN